MDLQQYAINAVQRTDNALAAGNIEEAIRVSGEATAIADGEWTQLYNSGNKESDNALIAGNFIAGRHLEALMQGGAFEEAYSTGALLLYRSTLAHSKSTPLAQSQLDILCRLLTAALETGERHGYSSGEPDSDAVDHFAHIITYLASMLYAFYTEVGERRPDTQILEEAYPLLEQMKEIGAIQYPDILINGESISSEDIAGVLPDLLGRSRALGMLNTD